MSIYIKNSGFTKTTIQQNKKKTENEINWTGNYDGKIANINVIINDDGNKEKINLELDNNDLMQMLGIQPINMKLEDRLTNDFFLSNNLDQVDLNPIIKKKIINKKSKKIKKKGIKKSKKRLIKK
jgi:hypothetical protein